MFFTFISDDFSKISKLYFQILAERETTLRRLTVKYTDSAVNQSVTNVSLDFLDLSPLDNQNILLGSATDPLISGLVMPRKNS